MNWDKRWNRNYCLSSAFPHSTTQSRLEDPSLEKWNEVYKRITALGNGSTNISLCHAQYLVWYIGILLGTLLKREKRAEADHIASSMALMMQQRPRFLSFFFFSLFLDVKHRSTTGYRENQGSQCNIYPNCTKPAFHPLTGHSTKSLIVFDKAH